MRVPKDGCEPGRTATAAGPDPLPARETTDWPPIRYRAGRSPSLQGPLEEDTAVLVAAEENE